VDPATDFAERLEIFFGEASDTVCHVYARLRGPEAAEGFQLYGTFVGPSCLYAETLPARFAFNDRGPGKSLLAEAIVPEPCFWTPDMPQLYQADLQLRRGDEVLASTTRLFGIRTLGASGRDLIYDNKRWVLRGVCREKLPPTDLATWREADTAMVVRNPDDELCRQASRVGVLIVADLDRCDADDIRRLSRWPAVAIVVLPGGSTMDLDGLAHNLLLAERFGPEKPVVPANWARLVLCEIGPLHPSNELTARLANRPVPAIAVRSAGLLSSVALGRAACDHLQRDLAGRAEWAGYIV
jgi:glycosyl hydrolase family 2